MEIIDNQNSGNETVIVFGGAGYVGRYFIKFLLKNNPSIRIIVVTRNISKKMFFRDERVKVRNDLNNIKARNCRIYNFAVSTAISFKEGETVAKKIINNIFSIIDKNFQGEIIHISSIAVYDIEGNEHNNPQELKHVTKSDVYTFIKAKSEQYLIKESKKSNINYKIIRIGNVIGPGSTWINKIVERLDEQKPLIGKEGQYYSNTTFIGNLVYFLSNYEEYVNDKHSIYNFCEFGNVTWDEYIKPVSDRLKIKPMEWNFNSYKDIKVGLLKDINFIKKKIYKQIVTNALKMPSATKYVLRVLNLLDANKLKTNVKSKVNKIGQYDKQYFDLAEYKMAKIYLNEKQIGVEGIDSKVLQDIPYTLEKTKQIIGNYVKYNF